MFTEVSDKQKELYFLENHDCTEVLAAGVVQVGKTEFGMPGLARYATKNFAGYDFLVGAYSKHIHTSKLRPLLLKWCRGTGMRYKAIEGGIEVESVVGNSPNRFLFSVMNNKAALDRIEGLTLGGAMLDEVVLMDPLVLERLSQRCITVGANSRIVMTCNPQGARHWVKRNLIDKTSDIGLKYLKFTFDDNPTISEEEVARLRSRYTGHEAQRKLDGEWVDAIGQIFPFGDVKPPTGEILEREACVDIGSGHDQGVTHALLFELRKTGWCCVNEWRHDASQNGYLDFDQQASAIVAKFGHCGQWITDHDKSFQLALERELTRKGHTTTLTPANKQVRVVDGINITRSMYDQAKFRISENCNELLIELEDYSWDPDAAARGEEIPIKVRDHGCDALRYWVIDLFMREDFDGIVVVEH